MKVPLALIGIALLVFILRGPSEHELHTFAWILGVVDAVLVGWSIFSTAGN